MKYCNSYDLAWSLEVAEVFRKKYARASKIFQYITNCGGNYPGWLLAHDQPKWNRYKKIIKLIANMDLDCQPVPISKHLCSYIEDELYAQGYLVGYTGIDRTN
ncbi:hypothetical protein LCGC14_2753790 [marine sediment metagenome]|uniref:Uncharacterized protein n=1 Tax=marine sediment metagenome TaxID=412755 RepID=A0A0F9BSQ1_9ZZZZ